MTFRIGLCVVLIAVVCGFTACDSSASVENVRPGAQGQVLDYGNGVYYFPYVGPDFGNALSTFIGQHPGWELQAMTGNGIGFYGANQGYFVCFRKK